jgi:hypothetical protein
MRKKMLSTQKKSGQIVSFVDPKIALNDALSKGDIDTVVQQLFAFHNLLRDENLRDRISKSNLYPKIIEAISVTLSSHITKRKYDGVQLMFWAFPDLKMQPAIRKSLCERRYAEECISTYSWTYDLFKDFFTRSLDEDYNEFTFEKLLSRFLLENNDRVVVWRFDQDLVKYFTRYPRNLSQSQLNELLRASAWHRKTEFMKTLIKQGADAKSVLHSAIETGDYNLEAAKNLLEFGVPYQFVDSQSREKYARLLCYICANQKYALAKSIIQQGVDAKLALKLAVESGDVVSARELLVMGVFYEPGTYKIPVNCVTMMTRFIDANKKLEEEYDDQFSGVLKKMESADLHDKFDTLMRLKQKSRCARFMAALFGSSDRGELFAANRDRWDHEKAVRVKIVTELNRKDWDQDEFFLCKLIYWQRHIVVAAKKLSFAVDFEALVAKIPALEAKVSAPPDSKDATPLTSTAHVMQIMPPEKPVVDVKPAEAKKAEPKKENQIEIVDDYFAEARTNVAAEEDLNSTHARDFVEVRTNVATEKDPIPVLDPDFSKVLANAMSRIPAEPPQTLSFRGV